MKKINPYTNVPPWINAYFQELRNGTRPIPYYALHENYDNVNDVIDALKEMDRNELNGLVLSTVYSGRRPDFEVPFTFNLKIGGPYTNLSAGDVWDLAKNNPNAIEELASTIAQKYCSGSPAEKTQKLYMYAFALEMFLAGSCMLDESCIPYGK